MAKSTKTPVIPVAPVTPTPAPVQAPMWEHPDYRFTVKRFEGKSGKYYYRVVRYKTNSKPEQYLTPDSQLKIIGYNGGKDGNINFFIEPNQVEGTFSEL